MVGCDHTSIICVRGTWYVKFEACIRLTLTLRALHGLQDNWGRFDFSRGRAGCTEGLGWGVSWS